MFSLRAFAFLVFLAPVVLAQQPTPIVPDSNLTPGDTFDVTMQDLCVPGYTKKVRNVPAEMKREVYERSAESHRTILAITRAITLFRSNSAAPIQSKISGRRHTEPRLGTPKLKTGSKA